MITTKIDTSRMLSASARLPLSIQTKLGDALDHVSAKFLKKFRDERLSGGGDAIKGRPHGLFMRFQRIFTLPFNSQGVKMGVQIYTTSPIAKLHEEGGTMTSEEGKRLAVPISASAPTTESASGAVKKKFGGTPYVRDVAAASAGKKLMPITVGGKTYLFLRTKKDQSPQAPLFVLQDRVQIKPRLKFYDTWENMRTDTLAIILKGLEDASKEAWR